MRKIIYSMILLSYFGSCFSQVKINETDRQRAEDSNVIDFFNYMVSNEYYEKIAKNDYYIFDTINGKVYYGKVHSGFFKGKITEIFKVDANALCKQIPNFRKLHGALLREIILSDIAKSNGLCNQSAIIINDISFKLDTAIIVFIDFMISGKEKQKIYKLNTADFSIIK